MELFIEVGLVLIVATIVSLLMKLIKVPLVVGYILTGIVVGPSVLGILASSNHLEFFSKVGVAVLLFVVGLSLSPQVIKEVGKVSLMTGLSQVIVTTFVGFFIASSFGFTHIQSIYIAIALTFSSTIIILKLLSDKGDLTKLYGKVATGFLLVQDLVATLILIVIPSIASGDLVSSLERLLITSIIVLIVMVITVKYILPRVAPFFWSNMELLFLFSISWGLGLAGLFYRLGFSIEIGALLAGVTLSTSEVSYEISSRLKPLRDFFLVLFFVFLGSQLVLGEVGGILLPALAFSLYVIVGNPLIMFFIMRLNGYERRTSFYAALAVGQISEFSLILLTLARDLNQIPGKSLSLMTLVGLITITVSSLVILHASAIFRMIDPVLAKLPLGKTKRHKTNTDENFEIILCGYDRVGREFINSFKKLKKSYLVLDFSPKAIKKLINEGIPHRYGDIEDVEFLDELPLTHTKLVISTVPDIDANIILTSHIHTNHPHIVIITLAQDKEEATKLYAIGASYVLMPHYLGAKFATELIEKYGIEGKGLKKEKDMHLKTLAE